MDGILEMTLRKIFIIILLGLSISACSESSDCVIADSIYNIENNSLSKKGKYLYLRTSGLNEKEHFYELFGEKPSFNECGIATNKALSVAHIDSSLGAPEKLAIKKDKIEITYGKNKTKNQFRNVLIVVN